jgi:hypothetical protein
MKKKSILVFTLMFALSIATVSAASFNDSANGNDTLAPSTTVEQPQSQNQKKQGNDQQSSLKAQQSQQQQGDQQLKKSDTNQ